MTKIQTRVLLLVLVSLLLVGYSAVQQLETQNVVMTLASNKLPERDALTLREILDREELEGLILLGSGAIMIFFWWYCTFKWVSRPLKLITSSLEIGDASGLKPLLQQENELGIVARLITSFFEQNETLQREIAERKQVENELLQTTKRVESLLDEERLLLDNTRDFLYRHDAQGVFHYMSTSVEKITGYSPAEMMQHYTECLTDHPMNQKVVEYTETALQIGKVSSPYPVEIYHKEGHRVSLEVSEQPYFIEGKVAGIVGVARDISERKKSDEQQRKLQVRLERAERMESLGVLAGGVAHDLNNILGPLVAYPELILHKLPPESPIRRQVEIIGKSAREAADVIQDLLALARRGRYEMRTICLNDLMNSYLESSTFLSLQESNPNVELQLKLGEGLPNIRGSATHLMKVLMNLVVNAFDAMPGGGTLTIKTTEAILDSVGGGLTKIDKGKYLILTVSDTGTGIDPQDISKIFQPYYSNKKMGNSGSGLGLSVVYGIIKDHKAYYDVFSDLDNGSEFLFYFPVTADEVEKISTMARDLNGTEKILVVDDVAEQREIASQLLSGLGYQVATAASGREAVTFLASQKVDLVILDMIMEKGFDGLDTYTEILRNHPGQKAIIASGFSATDRVRQMQSLGAGAYIKKPYTQRELALAVRDELDLPTHIGEKTAAAHLAV